MKLATIVPNLPPAVCGVYDYTRRLYQHLGFADPWTLLCHQEGAPWPGAKAVAVERSGRSLARALRDLAPTHIALQYTCFGYAKDGVPVWLADGLEQFLATGRARLAVMFHELHYGGPPWRRAFWRKRPQLALGRRLAGMADCALAAVPSWLELLKNRHGKAATLAPIPSNIDPVTRCRAEGPLALGVFGLPGTRDKALLAHRRLLEHLARNSAAFSLHIIGHGAESPSRREAVMLRKLRLQPPVRTTSADSATISRAIAQCQVMLSAAAGQELYKSGTVMAALAHGCAVVAAASADGDMPVLHAKGRRIAALAERLLSGAALETGQAGLKWYEENSGWPRAAEIWRRVLEQA